MKTFVSYLILGIVSVAALLGCSPSASQLKKVVSENPDILYAAIEADPQGFFEVVGKAQQTARDSGMAKQMEGELKRVLAEIKENKTPQSFDENRPSVGTVSAKITITEWADFKCGYCSKAHETMKEIVAKYPDKVRIQYKHLPILSPESKTAAEVMEAIALQDKEKALKFHDILFADQGAFRNGGEKYLEQVAKEVGADWSKAKRDSKSDKIKKIIDSDVAEAQKHEFSGTPGFLINGGSVHGAYPADFFAKVIEALSKEG